MIYIGCGDGPYHKNSLYWHRLRSIKALETDVAKLDSLHNDLGDIMAEGERDDFNDTWFACKTKCLFMLSPSWMKMGSIELSISTLKKTSYSKVAQEVWEEYEGCHLCVPALRWMLREWDSTGITYSLSLYMSFRNCILYIKLNSVVVSSLGTSTTSRDVCQGAPRRFRTKQRFGLVLINSLWIGWNSWDHMGLHFF